MPARIGEAELEALARADERVIRSIGDREIIKVVVRAPKIVSIVVKG